MRNQPGLLRYVCHLLLSGMLVLTTTPGWAEVRDVTPEEAAEIQNRGEEPTRAGGRATLGGRIGDNQAEGYLDVLQPLAGGERGLLFFNPKLSGSDNDEEEYSLGLGLRVLCPATEAIAGLNVFYDSRDTQHGNTFDQVGAGLEVLTTWVDARANYYWPDDKNELIESTSDTEVDRNTDYYLSDIYAEGHELLQLERIKTTTTTTTRYFERFEAALEGYDAELGVKLPFLPDWLETRIFAGYYNFEGDYTADLDGLKGRLEIRALPALTLDAEVYDNDDLTGSDYFFGARVNLPFDVVNLVHGKNPFAGTEAALQARRVAFRDRLSEMVIRDPHVRIHESGYLENEGLKEVDVDVDVDEDELVVMDDINFVSNGNLSGLENGTDEHPYNTVQEGVDNAFGKKNVYVYQGTGAYHENVTIDEDGLSLMGEGCAIEGYGGKSFGGGKYPALDGNVAGVNGPVIRVSSDNVLVRGLELTRTAGGVNPGAVDALGLALTIDQVGVLSENADNLTIGCNRFINQGYGVLGLYDATEPGAPADLNLQVLGNTFDDSTFGVQLYGRGPGGRFSTLVMDNTFGDLSIFDVSADLMLLDDVTLDVLDNRFLDPISTIFVTTAVVANDLALNLDGNRFEQGGNMILIPGIVQGDAALSLSGNELLGLSIVQVSGPAVVGGDLTLVMDDNFIQNGLMLATPGSVAGDALISISGNTVLDASGGAITLVGVTVGGDSTLVLDDNSIQNASGAGITAVIGTSGGSLAASVSGNDIRNAAGAGVTLVTGASTGNLLLVMSDNVITGNQGAGITAVLGGTTRRLDVVADNNRVTGNQGTGLFLSSGRVAGDAAVTITDSSFDGNAGAGLGINLPDVQGTLNVLIDPTSANNNAGGGMSLVLTSTDDLALTLEQVTANDNSGPGITVVANSISGSVQAAFLDVEASRNGAGGMIATLAANQELILGSVAPVPVGNRITANDNVGGFGVLISGFSSSGAVVSLTERMQTSGNAGGGSFRDLQAAENVNVLDGEVEANNNLGQGMVLTAESTNAVAIYQVGRLEANGNISGGANLTLVGHGSATAFLGLESPISLLPVPAQGGLFLNNNMGGGLTATIVSDEGGAGGGIGKTEANGNIGNGLSFNVIAEEQASLFLGLADGSLTNGTAPVVANNNAGNGISVNLFSATEGATLLLLGDGSANNNLGSGVQATLNAASEVLMGIGSVPFGGGAGNLGSFEASGNQQVGVGLSGTSTGSSALVILAGLTANSNVLDGVNVEANGLDGAQIVAGSYLVADSAIETLDNGGVGLRVNSTAPAGGALLLLSDVNASRNGSNGVAASFSGRDNITMVLGLGTDGGTNIFVSPVVANNNGASGLELSANSASGEVGFAAISFVANSNTSYGLDAHLNAYSNINVALGGLGGLLPLPVTIADGGGQLIGNDLGGLRLSATSVVGSVTAQVSNITVNNNAGPGAAAEISLTAGQNVTASLSDSTFNGNTSVFGLRLWHSAGSNAVVTLENVQASNNDGANFVQSLADAGGTSLLVVRNVTVTNNGGVGLVAHAQAVGSATVIVENVVANDNFQGLDLYATSNDGDADVRISNVVANANDTIGVEGDAITLGTLARIHVEDVRADGNGTYGVDLRTEGFGAANARVEVVGDLSVNNNQTGALFVANSGQTAEVIANTGDRVTATNNVNHGIVAAAEGNDASVTLTAGAVPAVNNNGQFGLVALAVGTNSAVAAVSNPSGTGNGSGNQHVDTAAVSPWQALLP